MEETKTIPINKEEKNNHPALSRQQRRAMERANEAAQITYMRLAELFLNFFMQNDPEGKEVEAKQKEVNAKWRMYCKSNNLVPEAFDTVDKYCAGLHKEYQDAKNQSI